MKEYLSPTFFFDFESEVIQELIADLKSNQMSEVEKGVHLYYRVRDRWRYNAFDIVFKKEALRSSTAAQKKHGHCIDKSIIYISGLRGLGIPARLHLAKVKNHIAVEKLIEKLGTNELTPHGMVDVFLGGKWVKATPAFNKELCRMIGVEPLDFNGSDDSIFQQYSTQGSYFMEYLEDYGAFADVPLDFIEENMRMNYPKLTALLNTKGELKL